MSAAAICALGILTMAAAPGDAPAKAKKDAPERLAIAYLDALKSGKTEAREYLLGGLTLTAEGFSIPNWKIVQRDPVMDETGELADAVKAMRELDQAGRDSLDMDLELGGAGQDGEKVASLTKEQAEKMLAPTKERAKAFQASHPVFSFVARVDKDVFWHPSNPWRLLVDDKLGDKGKYRLVVHRFHIEETKNGKRARVWPLRILRIKTKRYDSGWKVLPASDWNPDF